MPLLEATIRVNEAQPGKVVAILRRHWPSLKDVRVTLLGLSFKPGTSDVRESPAFPIMSELLRQGAVLNAHDPVALEEARKVFPRPEVNYCDDLHAALGGANAVVVVTPWREYRDVPTILRDRERPPIFVDARRAFDKDVALRYEGIGL